MNCTVGLLATLVLHSQGLGVYETIKVRKTRYSACHIMMHLLQPDSLLIWPKI